MLQNWRSEWQPTCKANCTSEAGRVQNQITALFFSSIFVFQIYLKEEATKHKNPQNLSILIFLFDIFPPYFYCISLFLHAFICKCSTCFILYSLHWAITSPPLRPATPPRPPHVSAIFGSFYWLYQVIHHHLLDYFCSAAWLLYHILTLITITVLSLFIYRIFSFELLP